MFATYPVASATAFVVAYAASGGRSCCDDKRTDGRPGRTLSKRQAALDPHSRVTVSAAMSPMPPGTP